MRLLKYCLLSLIILLFSTAYAQTVPDNLLQTAIRAAQTATGITELPISWSYVLERTRSSSLGCSLVTGTDLGVDVVYYNFTLIFTTSTHWLLAGSIVFGVASSLVNMGWMLGPVSLAPSRDKVPQYIAIHTTMVGLRGTVGQFAGVAVYKLSGDFVVPLVIAGAFLTITLMP